MKKQREPIRQNDDEYSAEEKLKKIIQKKKVEKEALQKIMDSLEKKRKSNI